jgi:hypothetical protein
MATISRKIVQVDLVSGSGYWKNVPLCIEQDDFEVFGRGTNCTIWAEDHDRAMGWYDLRNNSVVHCCTLRSEA